MTLVTYIPQENGDPITTKFAGFDFRSGEPTEVPDDAMMTQHFMVEHINAFGENRNTSTDREVKVLDVLKVNPYFRVDGAPEPAARKAGGRPRLPRTPEEYKGFAMEWFARAANHRALAQRWEDEAEMRDKLGVHDDGEIVSYLRSFFDARFHELKKAA